MSRSLHKAFDLRHMSDYRELAEVTIEDANTVLREAKNSMNANNGWKYYN